MPNKFHHLAGLAPFGMGAPATLKGSAMTASALVTLINARNADNGQLRAMYCDAFRADALHLVTANNASPLESAIAALPMGKAQVKGAQNKAVGEAIAAGVRALRAALPDGSGWIGAARGSFSKASKEDRAPYLTAHAAACAAFNASIEAAEAFADAQKKTAEEKAAIKAQKAAEKAEAEAAIVAAGIDARIASGELVRASDVVTLDKAGALPLIEALEALHASGQISAVAADALCALVEKVVVA